MELGGQEFRVLHEARGMGHRGHTVVLTVQPGSKLHDYAMKWGLCIEPVTMRKHRYLSLVRDFGKIIRTYGFDLINTHGSIDSWTASMAGRLSKHKPLIIRTRHKSTPISNNFRHRFLYGTLPHAIVTTGQTVRQEMIERNGIEESRIVSIPTGVDLGLYHPTEPNEVLKREFGANHGTQIVGTIAFFRDYKGLDYFLQAAKLILTRVPKIRFLLVGSGPEEPQLIRNIADLQLSDHVRLTGFRNDIPHILALMDVFVLSSVGAEGIPQSLTQALVMERGVVATAIGGIPEVVQDGMTGYLVPPRDSEQLAERICTLLSDQALGKRMGAAGRRLVTEQYSLETMLDRTEEFYEALLNQNTRIRRS